MFEACYEGRSLSFRERREDRKFQATVGNLSLFEEVELLRRQLLSSPCSIGAQAVRVQQGQQQKL